MAIFNGRVRRRRLRGAKINVFVEVVDYKFANPLVGHGVGVVFLLEIKIWPPHARGLTQVAKSIDRSHPWRCAPKARHTPHTSPPTTPPLVSFPLSFVYYISFFCVLTQLLFFPSVRRG